MHGVVYDPPKPGLPYLAVVLDSKGQVVVAHAVQSVKIGEALIQQTFEEFSKANGGLPLKSY